MDCIRERKSHARGEHLTQEEADKSNNKREEILKKERGQQGEKSQTGPN